MIFGATTVTFITLVENPAVRDRYNNPTTTEVRSPVGGCRFRPLTAQERTQEGFTEVEDPWRCTAPPDSTVLAAKANGLVEVNGVKYQIHGGPRVFDSFGGGPFKVTIICKRAAA